MSEQIVCSGGCEVEEVEVHSSVTLSSPIFAAESVTVGSLASFLTRQAQQYLAQEEDPDEEVPHVIAKEFKIEVAFVKDRVTVSRPTTFDGTIEEAEAAGWEDDEGNHLCPGCLGKTDGTLEGGALLEPKGAAELYAEEDDDQDPEEDGGLGGGQGPDQADDEGEE